LPAKLEHTLSGATFKTKCSHTWLKVTDSDKHSSLFGSKVINGPKKFYRTGPKTKIVPVVLSLNHYIKKVKEETEWSLEITAASKG